MSDIRLISEGERELKPLVRAALANELRLIEAGIKQTERKIEDYEKRYGMSTQAFISSYERDEQKQTMETDEWIGEYRILMRLKEKAETLKDIRIEN